MEITTNANLCIGQVCLRKGKKTKEKIGAKKEKSNNNAERFEISPGKPMYI